jgi:hypothetical protein
MSRTAAKHKRTTPKKRSTGLAIWLVLIAVHGVIFTLLTWNVIKPGDYDAPTWSLWALLLLSIANVAAAVALWYWKRWGFQLYGVTTVVRIVVGLVATASQLWVFYAIIPFVILGYLLRPYWDQLE